MKPAIRVTHRCSLALAVAMAIGAGSAQAAISLNPRGTGQVLVYPYYTVNGSYSTLFAVVNTTGNGKALKVRFHEGYNGRVVGDLNVYLGPYDVWAAAVSQQVPIFSSGFAIAQGELSTGIITSDNSCTVPQIATSGDTAGMTFFSSNYTDTNADGGPQTLERANEGHFDIIEMGEITNAIKGTLSAITPVNGVPPNCAQVVNAWGQNGYWVSNPNTDLSSPGGGLYGAEAIIDGAQGLFFAANAEAIDGFSTAIQHTALGMATPDLNTASKSTDGTVTALVPNSTGLIQASFKNPIDAVSALFVADTVYNTFDVESSVGAQTDWLLTFPTKRFYVDPAIVSSVEAKPPFDKVFGADSNLPGTSCQRVGAMLLDREARARAPTFCFLCPGGKILSACYESSVLTFNTSASTLNSHLTLASSSAGPYSTISTQSFDSGHLVLGLPVHGYPVATGGKGFPGLPVIGFGVTNYVNANVTAGVLANYSGLNMHRTHESCIAGGAPCS